MICADCGMSNWDWVSRCPRCGALAPRLVPARAASVPSARGVSPVTAARGEAPPAQGRPLTFQTDTVRALLEPSPIPVELYLTAGPRKLAASATIILAGAAAGWFLADPLAPLLLEAQRRIAVAGPSAASFLLPLALFLLVRLALLPRLLTHPRVDRETFAVTHWYETSCTADQHYFSNCAPLPDLLEDAVDAVAGGSRLGAWAKDRLFDLSPLMVSHRMVRTGLILALADAAVLTSYLKVTGHLTRIQLGVPSLESLALIAAIPLAQLAITAVIVLVSKLSDWTRTWFASHLELAHNYWYVVTFSSVFQLPLYLTEAFLFRQLPSLVAPLIAARAAGLTTLLLAHGLSLAMAGRDNRWLQRALPDLVATATNGDLEARRVALRRLAGLPDAKDDATIADTFRLGFETADPEIRAYAEEGLGVSAAAAREFMEVCGLTPKSSPADVEAAFGPGVHKRTHHGDETWAYADGALEVVVTGRPDRIKIRALRFRRTRITTWLGRTRKDVVVTLGAPARWSSRSHFTYGIPDEHGERVGSVSFYFDASGACWELNVDWR